MGRCRKCQNPRPTATRESGYVCDSCISLDEPQEEETKDDTENPQDDTLSLTDLRREWAIQQVEAIPIIQDPLRNPAYPPSSVVSSIPTTIVMENRHHTSEHSSTSSSTLGDEGDDPTYQAFLAQKQKEEEMKKKLVMAIAKHKGVSVDEYGDKSLAELTEIYLNEVENPQNSLPLSDLRQELVSANRHVEKQYDATEWDSDGEEAVQPSPQPSPPPALPSSPQPALPSSPQPADEIGERKNDPHCGRNFNVEDEQFNKNKLKCWKCDKWKVWNNFAVKDYWKKYTSQYSLGKHWEDFPWYVNCYSCRRSFGCCGSHSAGNNGCECKDLDVCRRNCEKCPCEMDDKNNCRVHGD